MTDEPVRVVFHLNQDPRLVEVVRTAVKFQSMQAGLETESVGRLAKAAEDVCRETISQLAADAGGLDVTLETFPDRIEIAIHCRGQMMPAVGLETFAFAGEAAGGEGGINGLELLTRVDRVLYNTEEGVARTTLVKFLPAHH
jgi:hypothetical protein